MLRQIKVAKDVAVKARTAAMISLKAVLVNAPPELRETLQPLSKMALIDRCAGLRPGPGSTVAAAPKHTLRPIARRWQQLNEEIKTHEALLAELTGQLVPQLVAAFGIGPDTAAELLIVAGDNIDRVRSEPAWARLCGVAPIPASSGLTTRHRLNRGGHRQANAALYRAVIVRMQHPNPPAPTSPDEPSRARARPRSSAASSACLPARPGHSSVLCGAFPGRLLRRLVGYRSVNAAAEAFFSSLEWEVLSRHQFDSTAKARAVVIDWCYGFYNTQRRHSAAAGLSPINYETTALTREAA